MDFLTYQAKFRPDSLAVHDLTFVRAWSFSEFNQLVGKFASYLLKRGIKRGDRVACISKNRAEVIALHFACARAKAIFVPLNWRLALFEIESLLADCEPTIVFGDDKAAEIGIAFEPIGNLIEDTENLVVDDALEFDNDAACLILYSSGTTGQPKGAIHTEASLMETILNSTLLYEVDQHSAFLNESPMFHIIGLISSVRPVLYNGGKLVISDGFIPERTLDRLSDPILNITHYFCIPQMANSLRQVSSFDPSRLKNLKALLTGGAPHPEVQIRRWLNDGIAIVDGYGMSEAGSVLGMPHKLDLIDKNAGCVGINPPRISIRLHDAQGKTIKVGELGEVQLKGPNLFIGYWGKETLFENSFTADGWFETGDIAVQNSLGCYRIVDRKKDMFISGGENVYPAEVEAIALKHPHVLECAMIGVPDEKWGEVGCLFIVCQTNINALDHDGLMHYLTAHIAKYKVPKSLVVLEALPRNGGGKVLKHALYSSVVES
ncbi:AMP-binding protein [Alteromonas sp. CI.11.F.A3]|uniref:AMP-binding protein n=1 Tax=Alteromonas sp. CI.11.F.A3 TaxID=3079555 RepID=UPI002941F4BB|nr:AMP-binding protein [Alteromonas sp. CI.11.F.A3]WOI36381.1 AMP-binding protein [Alteromonas sp. CI.11.F.A3]